MYGNLEDFNPLPVVLGILGLCLVGFFGNSMIILATMMSSRLRNRCNILICILAIADLLACVYFIQVRVMMLMKWYFLKHTRCYLYSFYGLFALNVQSGLELVLSVDRLLAVTMPIRYTGLPILLYVMMMSGVLIYATLLTLYGYWKTTAELVSVCSLATVYSSNVKLVRVAVNFFISLVVTSIYVLAHLKCRNIEGLAMHQQSIKRIRTLLNSLTIITVLYIFTWLVTATGVLVAEIFEFDPIVKQEINRRLAWLIIISTLTNFFVHYWRAPEYRSVFVYLLCIKRRDRVHRVSPVGQRIASTAHGRMLFQLLF